MRYGSLSDRWAVRSLTTEFLLAGGLVSFTAMVAVGLIVTSLIEAGVTRNSSAATALYVDSVIAPLLPDMQRNEVLSDAASHALDETLGQGALGRRLLSFKLWSRDGTILYSSDKTLVGKRFELNPQLREAFSGNMIAQFDKVDESEKESAAERASGLPLLEIYNPVLQPWSGEVVAVSEFYEIAIDFQRSLREALMLSWLAVAAVTGGFFLLLSAIVVRGSRKIDSQSRALGERVSELSKLLAQNRSLRVRVQRASQRVTGLHESYLRRIGADLHDGPAQFVALAALRLQSGTMLNPRSSGKAREREILSIKSSLDEAMHEIRSLCNGLVLPHIESAELSEILALVVSEHEKRTDSSVELIMSDIVQPLSPSVKICIYRFVQETLNNAHRHGGGIGQSVKQTFGGGRVFVEVADKGPGFDPTTIDPGSLGLAGLRERVRSLGGNVVVIPSSKGTSVKMSLNIDDMEQP